MDAKTLALDWIHAEIARLQQAASLLDPAYNFKQTFKQNGHSVLKRAAATSKKISSLQKGYWARMSPEERAQEVKRRMRKRRSNKAAKAA